MMQRPTETTLLPMVRQLMRSVLLAGVCLAVLPTASAMACPMCKTATETAGDDRQPGAYLASILTMLAMPSAVFTVLGVSMYRISRRDEQVTDEMNLRDQSDA